MTTLIPIHRAAMFHVVHVRSRMVVGARSRFHRGLEETSSRNSSKSRWVRAMSPLAVGVVIRLGGDLRADQWEGAAEPQLTLPSQMSLRVLSSTETVSAPRFSRSVYLRPG